MAKVEDRIVPPEELALPPADDAAPTAKLTFEPSAEAAEEAPVHEAAASSPDSSDAAA
jgi:hypothetical protein